MTNQSSWKGTMRKGNIRAPSSTFRPLISPSARHAPPRQTPLDLRPSARGAYRGPLAAEGRRVCPVLAASGSGDMPSVLACGIE
uniref:Uncharacterized protein n=1 Tax=Knipowitschia caucasica TaxID=637954 RepID=A0AAV2K9A5_KNICA